MDSFGCRIFFGFPASHYELVPDGYGGPFHLHFDSANPTTNHLMLLVMACRCFMSSPTSTVSVFKNI